MKISTLVWLKSFGGEVNPVYSSRLYAIEIDEDGIGYENDARFIDKVRSASYSAQQNIEWMDAGNTITGISKVWKAGYLHHQLHPEWIDTAAQITSITKVRSAGYLFETVTDGMDAGNALVGITKKLAGYYLRFNMPGDQMDAGSVVTSLDKHRAVREIEPPTLDIMDAGSVMESLAKSRKVLNGEARDEFDATMSVISIQKNSHVLRDEHGDELTAESSIIKILKIRKVVGDLYPPTWLPAGIAKLFMPTRFSGHVLWDSRAEPGPEVPDVMLPPVNIQAALIWDSVLHPPVVRQVFVERLYKPTRFSAQIKWQAEIDKE